MENWWKRGGGVSLDVGCANGSEEVCSKFAIGGDVVVGKVGGESFN